MSRFLPGAGVRYPSGLKYHRVTGGGADKLLYDRSEAMQAVEKHVTHFCRSDSTNSDKPGLD